MSIRLRLTLWYSGLLAVTLLVFGVIVYSFLSWNTFDDLREQVKGQSDNLGISGRFTFNTLKLDLDRRIEDKDMYVQLINYKEGVIRQSSNLKEQNTVIPYPEAAANPQSEFVEFPIRIGKSSYTMVTYQRPITINNELVGLLQVGAIAYNEEKFLSGLRTSLIFSSLVVVLIAFTIGMIIAKQALRPIGRVIRATQQIEKGSDLSVRIPSAGPKDEISLLVDTLNSMLSRLEKAYNELDEAYMAQRRFVSDASHELRTPLTTIRGNIDLLEKMWSRAQQSHHSAEGTEAALLLNAEHWNLSNEAMSDISAEAKRMTSLVGDLLALARADAGHRVEKEQLELLPLTEEVVRRAMLLPRTAEWRVGDLELLKGFKVHGNYNYLQQLLFIFIENAFKYTPDGYVELSSVRKDDYIGWRIQDTGIGMNQDEIPRIFDRFYRADESRGVTVGTGLGLSIAKWILDEHKGSVEVVTGENEGTTFIIWLPIDFSESRDSTIIKETDLVEG
ncbi:HAMP domain-containing histidine kinase [Paenibacillus sp. GSMTC-2017]|uniref:sensor histidine kinase n=1 Tax=Paenibacillus sp. GSMTC-2017 TaxID=2794350 RepID=UPI0018D92FC3|nr:HAMP domain-containing sensor histidine kinase [Paenibacillus sp. GSMTC-2017]MBH5319269.1 HAMP domain-containing histidine kinase [Paenibacillus sp. GSMTC-2017]